MCLSEGILKERRALVTGSSVAGLTLKGLPKGAQPSAKGRGSVWRHKDSFLHPLILSLWSHLQEPGGPLTKGSWSESVECPPWQAGSPYPYIPTQEDDRQVSTAPLPFHCHPALPSFCNMCLNKLP